jgi:hypothetical protein
VVFGFAISVAEYHVGKGNNMNSTFHGGTRVKPSKLLPMFLAIAITNLFSLLNSSLADLNNGLVAYYPFNGNANDASGNGNHAIIHDASETVDRFGSASSAYDFNGSSSYIDIPQNPSIDLTTQFTLSAWIYQRGSQYAGYRIIDKCDSGSPNGVTFDTYGANTGGRQLRLQGAGTGTPGNVVGSTQYALLQWHHVVATVSGTLGSVYLDGTLDGTGDAGNIPHNNLNIFIGRAHPYNGGLTEWFNGAIDDVRIYNRALSAPEIMQLYNETLPHLAPQITKQPANQTINAGASVIFSVSATGDTPLTYQWRFEGQNITGATNASLHLSNARASVSGGYSVRVANAAGSVVSATAHLAVLGGDTYGQTVFRRPDSPASERPPGKDSLVIVTHGWQRSWAAPNTDWVGDLVYSIDAAVSAQGNWYVESLLWETDAHTVLPQKAAQNGEEIGALRGRQIATEGWSHVHFIAHSAGSALIQAATRQIKARSPSTTVHTTFLDPFVGVTTIDRLTYGETADWADSYFAEDVTSWQTRGRLSHAHNVNVTAIDPLTKPMLVFSSTANSTPAVDTHPDSTHGWPYHFYFNTVPPNSQSGAEGYGFPLSKEGGGWANRGNFQTGNSPVALGTTGNLPDVQLGLNVGTPFDFISMPLVTGGSGTDVLPGGSFILHSTPAPAPQVLKTQTTHDAGAYGADETGTNAWLSCSVTVTDNINFVACDVAFTSANGAESLLTVYWNTNVIGTVDERTAEPGLHLYRFPLEDDVSSGVFALGFRLDSFTNTASSVTVTNVTTGFAGSAEPIVLAMNNATNGLVMTMAAPSNYNYLAYASTNLVEWTPFAILVNTNGIVPFFDPAMSNYQHRFYRVTRP